MFKNREVWRSRLIAALLFAGAIVVYLPVAGYDFTNFDDPSYVTENPVVQAGLTWKGIRWAFNNAQTGNWHPLTWITHMMDAQVYGLRAGGHHFTNALLHAGSSVVLFFLLRSLTRSIWPSAAAAALFALHPLHVESVAWVAERKDVLSGLFGLLSLWAYAEYARRRNDRQPDQTAFAYYALVLVTLALGLMSKAMLVTWPCVMLLLDYWPLRRIKAGTHQSWVKANGHLGLEKLPLLALSAVIAIVTVIAQNAAGATAPLEQMPLRDRVQNAVVAYVQYIDKSFWPADLAVIYPQVRQWPLGEVALSLIVLAGISALVWWQRRQRPYLVVGWLWFVGTLVPVIGLVQVGNQARADRYMYLPSIGLYVAICWGAADLIQRYSIARPAVRFCAVVALGSCAIATRTQLGYWRNSATLFQHALAVTRNNVIAWNSLGFYYADSRDMKQARQCFDSALAINPANAFGWSGRAKVALESGQTAEAIDASERALQANPKLADAHTTLAQALLKAGRTADALAHYEAAVALRPDSPAAQYNLANALTRAGQLEPAREHYEKALELDASSASTHSNLGYVLAGMGRLEQAIREFRAALALEPGYWQARYGLGDALGRAGRKEEAIQELLRVIRDKPDLAAARQRLSQIAETNPPAGKRSPNEN